MKNKKNNISLIVLVVVVLSIIGLVVFNNISYAVDTTNLVSNRTSNTVYHDFGDVSGKIDNKYSASTILKSWGNATEFSNNVKVDKSSTVEVDSSLSDEDKANREFTYLLNNNNDYLSVLIKNSAVDKDGNLMDVVIDINDVSIASDIKITSGTGKGKYRCASSETSDNYIAGVRFSIFKNYRFFEDGFTQAMEPTSSRGGGKPTPINKGDPLLFGLTGRCADVKVTVTYYKAGTYNTTTKTGTIANITGINSFYYDFDVPAAIHSDRPASNFFNGDEGILPMNGASKIYYNKNKKIPYVTDINASNNHNYVIMKEQDNGIAVKKHNNYTAGDSKDTNAVWYQDSAFVLTDLSSAQKGQFSFRYGGTGCGIPFGFFSPYQYNLPSPVKEVVNKKEKYYPGDTFTYKISQYVPNNYFADTLGFHEVYENIPKTTRYTSFQISDSLHGALTIEENADIRVENELNVKQTKFRIEKYNLEGRDLRVYATADCEASPDSPGCELLKESSFYGHTYSLFIPVKIKSSGVLTKEIPNVATTTIQEPGTPEPIEQETPEVKVDVYFKVTTYYYKEGTTEQLISPVVESDKQNGDSYTTNSQPSNLDSKWELVPSATTVSPSSQGTSGTINGSNVVVKYYYKLADKYARLKKTDPKGNFVIGAKLAVYDGNTKVAEWTTKKGYDSCNLAVQTTNEEAETTGCNVITPVTANKTYTVKEEVTPVGYATSPDGSLVIDANGNSESGLTIVNPPIKVCVMTVDGNDKPITGIEVEIRNKLGSKYKDFISSEQWYCMDQVPVGDYELEETKLVGEYEKSPIQKETVKNTSETQYIKIINQLKVPKTSLDTTRILGIIGIVFGMFGVSLFVILKYRKQNN